MNYFAKENQVMYFEPGKRDHATLFLTVHLTPSRLSPEKQAEVLADMLNDLPPVSK